jgi:RimJ/RimL family protein N-acetyltransferase
MLRGERVTLRALEREDLRLLWEANNDLEVELLGGGFAPRPKSYAEIEARFERDIADEGQREINFVIEADGTAVGTCGLRDLDWTARCAALGIAIFDRHYWGQGYGREAVDLLLEYAFRIRNLNRVWLDVLADNERALRSYRAVGFVEEGRLRQDSWSEGRFKDSVVMGILRAEWLARREQAVE